MNIEYTGRATTVTPKHKTMAHAELERMNQMLGRIVSAHVILTEDKHRQIAEVTIKTATDELIATCEGTDMHTVLHDAFKKIEQQAIRHKERKMTVERHCKPNSSEPLIELTSTAT